MQVKRLGLLTIIWEEVYKHMWHKLASLLIVLSAANIGLMAIAHVDAMSALFGDLTHTINALVGVSGLYMLLINYTTLLKKA